MRNNLLDFGYPKTGDNARKVPFAIYDTATIATGTTTYNLFNNTTLSATARNKNFPPAGSEIYFIQDIVGLVKSVAFSAYSANLNEFLVRSFLQIIVNDREVVKLPAYAFMRYLFSDKIGDSAFAYPNQKIVGNGKRLKYPIILNSNDHVQINLVTSANGATAMNTYGIKVTLCGYKYSKLTDVDVDFVKQNRFSKLDAVIYDTQAASGTAQTWTLFATNNKAATDFSKSFPLSDSEAFVVEAIQSQYVSNDSGPEFATLLGELMTQRMDITINDAEIYSGYAEEFISLLHFTSGTFDDANPTSTTALYVNNQSKIKVLETPIVIPANSRVAIKLVQPTISVTLGSYFSVALHGTLTRKVA